MIVSVGILIVSVDILLGSVGILIGSVGILIGFVGILIGSVGILIHWYFECWYFEPLPTQCMHHKHIHQDQRSKVYAS